MNNFFISKGSSSYHSINRAFDECVFYVFKAKLKFDIKTDFKTKSFEIADA